MPGLGNVIGHGVDIVVVADFTKLLSDGLSPYLSRYFTPQELVSAGTGKEQAEKLAGRFAVKESVMKALGVGWGHGVSFTDVEIVNQPTGTPTVVLHRTLASLQAERGIESWLVTTAHAGGTAIASVIAIRGRPID